MPETKEKHNLTLLTTILIAGSIATFFIISEPKSSYGVPKEVNLVGMATPPITSISKQCPTPQVTSTIDDLVTVSGCYSLFSNFPKRFFDESIIPKEQIIRVTDAQYLSLRKMHNGNKPYDFTTIYYSPEVYGQTRPDGIALGDSAFPSLNNGHPLWGVMVHEQGHNFFGGTSAFYGTLAFGYPFLQESFAVLSEFYAHNTILKNSAKFRISPNTIKSVRSNLKEGRSYQQGQYNLYISRGKPFNISDVLTSQALDYKMITYGERYGWSRYTKFTKAFEDGIAPQFTFHHDGASAEEQSTYAIAALSAAFNKDFRADFRKLNFPIDEPFYSEIYPKIKSYIIPTKTKRTK